MVKYYYCKKCGNIVEAVNDKCNPVCCGESMSVLTPNTVDAAKEKHVPEISFEKGCVVIKVGSVAHPMTEEHLIQWITLETSKGIKRHVLKAGEVPMTRFALTEDEDPIAVYAYCNLHGLWKAAF